MDSLTSQAIIKTALRPGSKKKKKKKCSSYSCFVMLLPGNKKQTKQNKTPLLTSPAGELSASLVGAQHSSSHLPCDVINFPHELWCHNSASCPVLQSREMWGQLTFPKRNIHHAESGGGEGGSPGEENSKAGPRPEWPRSFSTHRSGKLCQRLFDLTIEWALY